LRVAAFLIVHNRLHFSLNPFFIELCSFLELVWGHVIFLDHSSAWILRWHLSWVDMYLAVLSGLVIVMNFIELVVVNNNGLLLLFRLGWLGHMDG